MVRFMRILRPALVLFCAMTLLCGVIYPALVTGAAQWWFPHQAYGSVIDVALKDGTEASYGSELIAQEFSQTRIPDRAAQGRDQPFAGQRETKSNRTGEDCQVARL